MQILPPPGHATPWLAALVAELRSPAWPFVWRRRAAAVLAASEGVIWAKAMTPIAGAASDGFGAGIPDLRRQILLTAWRSEGDFEAFARHPVARRALARPRSTLALFEVTSTRGSHYGATPLRPGEGENAGPFAALTLGRCTPRRLVRFLREGARLSSFVRDAPGLLAAASAGSPLTGNCTLSVWESEAAMLGFAYRDRAGHDATVRKRPPILVEQLNARMRLRRVEGQWRERVNA